MDNDFEKWFEEWAQKQTKIGAYKDEMEDAWKAGVDWLKHHVDKCVIHGKLVSFCEDCLTVEASRTRLLDEVEKVIEDAQNNRSAIRATVGEKDFWTDGFQTACKLIKQKLKAEVKK